jgi:hypothetical protein
LTDTEIDALAAIQCLDDLSAPELLRSLLADEILRRSERDPAFVQVRRARVEARLRREGKLIQLPSAHEAS